MKKIIKNGVFADIIMLSVTAAAFILYRNGFVYPAVMLTAVGISAFGIYLFIGAKLFFPYLYSMQDTSDKQKPALIRRQRRLILFSVFIFAAGLIAAVLSLIFRIF